MSRLWQSSAIRSMMPRWTCSPQRLGFTPRASVACAGCMFSCAECCLVRTDCAWQCSRIRSALGRTCHEPVVGRRMCMQRLSQWGTGSRSSIGGDSAFSMMQIQQRQAPPIIKRCTPLIEPVSGLCSNINTQIQQRLSAHLVTWAIRLSWCNITMSPLCICQ